MQANLTTNIILSQTNTQFEVLEKDGDEKERETSKSMGKTVQAVTDEKADNDEDDSFLESEDKYDQLWKEIEQAESNGDKIMFHSILHEFTDARLFLPRHGEDSLINKMKPRLAQVSSTESIHYIAGHMKTGDYDEKVAAGFREDTRYPIPGMVTNVFREFANQKQYDFVIFDLGCTMTATVKAVLLGVDYIVSPFKCERACKTAAEIVPKKLRDWHIKKEEAYALKPRDAAQANLNEIPTKLKGFPCFLGAFAVGVKLVKEKPTKPYQRNLDEIFNQYDEVLKGRAGFGSVHPQGELKLRYGNLEKFRQYIVQTTEGLGKEAEGGGILPCAIPCVSWFYDAT